MDVFCLGKIINRLKESLAPSMAQNQKQTSGTEKLYKQNDGGLSVDRGGTVTPWVGAPKINFCAEFMTLQLTLISPPF